MVAILGSFLLSYLPLCSVISPTCTVNKLIIFRLSATAKFFFFLSELFLGSWSRLFYDIADGLGARTYCMASVGQLMMQAAAVTRVPPD